MLIFLGVTMLILMAFLSYIYWFKPNTGTGVDLSPKGYLMAMLVMAGITMYAGYFVYHDMKHEQRFTLSETFQEDAHKLLGNKGEVAIGLSSTPVVNEPYKTAVFIWNEGAIDASQVRLQAQHKELDLSVSFPSKENLPEEMNALKERFQSATTIPTWLTFPAAGVWEVSIYEQDEKLGDFVLKAER